MAALFGHCQFEAFSHPVEVDSTGYPVPDCVPYVRLLREDLVASLPSWSGFVGVWRHGLAAPPYHAAAHT